jgi:hypothetical protein
MLSFLIGCLIFLTVIFGIGMNVGASLCNKHWAGRQMTNTVIGYKGTYYRVLTENQMIDLEYKARQYDTLVERNSSNSQIPFYYR